MQEQFPTPLEEQRFHVSGESFKYMHALRNGLQKVQEKYPEFQAISFFGSRTLGKEREDSDIDGIIFFDKDALLDRIQKETGSLHKISALEQFLQCEREVMDTIKDTWDGSFLDTGKDEHFHIHAIDSSKGALDEALQEFQDINPDDIQAMRGQIFQIITPFFLATGNIYPIRRYILESFEKDPNGEGEYQKLIELLHRIERKGLGQKERKYEVPEFGHFPQTLAEAKEYFLKGENAKTNAVSEENNVLE